MREWDGALLGRRQGANRAEGVMPMPGCEALLRDAARNAGLDYFLMALFPRADCAGFAENQLCCNWPSSLRESYTTSDVFYCSRLIATLKETCMPVSCDGACFAGTTSDKAANGTVAQFLRHGLHHTLAFNLHDARLSHYLFAFSGNRAPLARQEQMKLVYSAMEMLDGFVPASVEGPAEPLSPREVECLRWTAAGKSGEEIAIILSLSSHTVVSYLKSAMRKLESVNRMQAVARACRYRLI
jgi:DNA-binding CsgD family transcriptional regulator